MSTKKVTIKEERDHQEEAFNIAYKSWLMVDPDASQSTFHFAFYSGMATGIDIAIEINKNNKK